MLEHPKAVGDRSALAVMIGLYEADIPFLLPFGENTRYDLVLELGSGLARVQCKTGRLRQGAVRFKTCSTYDHHPYAKPSRDYAGQVDYFAVYCPETSGVYLIPIGDLPNRASASLRIDPPRNNQSRFIRFGSDYEIAKVSVVAG